jgi:hypothetical protein
METDGVEYGTHIQRTNKNTDLSGYGSDGAKDTERII